MAKPFAKQFYASKAWEDCRLAFLRSKFFICERCGGASTIAHHKTYLSPENINDPYITLGWDNLEALCDTCHNQEHHGGTVTRTGLFFNEDGELVQA